MSVKEKVGFFDYQSGNSQGNLIHLLGMNPGISEYNSFIRNLDRHPVLKVTEFDVTIWAF